MTAEIENDLSRWRILLQVFDDNPGKDTILGEQTIDFINLEQNSLQFTSVPTFHPKSNT